MRLAIDRWLPLAAAIAVLAGAHPADAAAKTRRKLEGVVNLNIASAEQLALLPGIGPVVAERIVEARAGNPFQRTWEITRVKGVGPKLFRKLEDRLRVEGISDLRVVEPPKAIKRGGKHKGKRRRGPKILTFERPAPKEPFVAPPPSAAVRPASKEPFVGPPLSAAVRPAPR
ncbi:MAG TPA: helix-hairpin-helix domain-containing protein [Vulgatibacter sp.]|nr:helix-hairpin-helix domain-containing protein [Vulgatibacter sp.]